MHIFSCPNPGYPEKIHLIDSLWPSRRQKVDTFNENTYAAYFQFLLHSLSTLESYSNDFAVQDIKGIHLIIRRLSRNPRMTRNDVKKSIRRDFLNTENKKIHRSIEFAVSLWLGLKLSSHLLHTGPAVAGDTTIEWPPNQDLQTTVDAEFDRLISKTVYTEFVLDHSLTYERLLKYRQVRIIWTNNLIDHLKLEGHRGQRALWIYQHRVCLENHLRCSKGEPRHIIRQEALLEAIRTLDLLFPFGDPQTARFLAKEGRQNLYVPPCRDTAHLQSLSHFKYWNGRLAQLLNLYQGPPESKWQYFRDHRNFGQWASLWLAIFLVAFITIVFGVLSSYFAAKSAKLSEQANWIAIAASCVENPDNKIFKCDKLSLSN
ncbi:unnamed protein product [Periconia digitata]|uniref:Uncharacterized protein n=1 Tax=Periconia digitata TaxID=1303443 RepID=A0A9W4UW33_9PLEO|nr:unnamed protein product [Periconia digitata]